MAKYEYTYPQTAQTVNVGQFGPSEDSLQDWRSVFTAAAEVEKLVEDVKQMIEDLNGLKEETAAVLVVAERAATEAEEINTSIRLDVAADKAEVEQYALTVEQDKLDVEASGVAVEAAYAAVTRQATLATTAATESKASMEETSKLVNTLTGITASAHYTSKTEPTAEYNQSTGELRIGIPATLAGTTRGVESVWHNGAYVSGPQVKLTAEDVGAFAVDGSSKISVPLDFSIGGSSRQGFVVEANADTGSPEFKLLYSLNNKPQQRVGLVLDTQGNAAIGGELFVQNRGLSNSKVYHQNFRPTATDIGAIPLDTCYSKEQSDNLYMRKGVDTYTANVIDAKINAVKLPPVEHPAYLYAWQGNGWTAIASSLDQYEQEFIKISSNETRITVAEADILKLKEKKIPYTKSVWRGANKAPSKKLTLDKIYTVVLSLDSGSSLYGSITFTHHSNSSSSKFVVALTATVNTILTVTGGALSTETGVVREIICHNFVEGE